MKKGFTVIELIVVIAVFGIAVGIFFSQRDNVNIAKRDEQRKVAINAMYYNLEEVFYTENGYYPETIDENNLKAMDPNLFTDPNGINLGNGESNYRYEPTNCEDSKCKSYTLRADLEKEDDYIKNSRH